MSLVREFLLRLLGLMTIAGALAWTPVVLADEYGDVNGLLRSGELAQALARADRYLTGKPRDPQMRFLKGVIQAQAGHRADAIETYTSLTQDYPELSEPYNNLAVLYAAQGRFDKARVALEQALRANPGYATAHENLGDVYAKLAALSYGKARELDPANPSLAPKLALIGRLFAPADASAGRDGASPTAAPASAAGSGGVSASGGIR